jgi:hypothetical protein
MAALSDIADPRISEHPQNPAIQKVRGVNAIGPGPSFCPLEHGIPGCIRDGKVAERAFGAIAEHTPQDERKYDAG